VKKQIALNPRSRLLAALLSCAVCMFNAHAAPPAVQVPTPLNVPDTIAERVQPCVACHGKEGRATNLGYFPRIAGKPAGYLFNQLVNFRDGHRHNAVMNQLIANMPDAYLQEMAAYFAALELPYPAAPSGPATTDVLAHGEALVVRGDTQRAIPACTQCHGAAMTGVAPAIPGLLGLPRDYLIAQFGAWRTGQRHAAAPDCMARVTEKLDTGDINAVASWLAAQPVPARSRPATSIALPLPLTCGSDLR
jgi:cytochrome c553